MFSLKAQLNNKVFLITLLLFSIGLSAHELEFPVVEVIDGDTIKSMIILPAPLNNVSIRIKGIDAPETGGRAQCEQEKVLGEKARTRLNELLQRAKFIEVHNYSWDRYGGRIVGDVFYNGINVGTKLVEEHFARPYDGTSKRLGWCSS